MLAGGILLWIEFRISKHIHNIPVSGFSSTAAALVLPVSKKKYMYGSFDISVEAKMTNDPQGPRVYVGSNHAQHILLDNGVDAGVDANGWN